MEFLKFIPGEDAATTQQHIQELTVYADENFEAIQQAGAKFDLAEVYSKVRPLLVFLSTFIFIPRKVKDAIVILITVLDAVAGNQAKPKALKGPKKNGSGK